MAADDTIAALSVTRQVAAAHARSADANYHFTRPRRRIREVLQADLAVAQEHEALHRAQPISRVLTATARLGEPRDGRRWAREGAVGRPDAEVECAADQHRNVLDVDYFGMHR